jgi:mannose-6-phosphate isomerase-like protein (cupin superfamily)
VAVGVGEVDSASAIGLIEWFYVMEGEMTVQLGDQTIIGRAGDSLWIPRGTVHRFKGNEPPMPGAQRLHARGL